MRKVRVFVSSPGDVEHERLRVERVVERLNGELAGSVRLETVRWERAFYQAHESFQRQTGRSLARKKVVQSFPPDARGG